MATQITITRTTTGLGFAYAIGTPDHKPAAPTAPTFVGNWTDVDAGWNALTAEIAQQPGGTHYTPQMFINGVPVLNTNDVMLDMEIVDETVAHIEDED